MKLLFSTIALFLSKTSVVHGAGTSFGSMNSCTEQAGCLKVTVNEIASKCGSHICEYEVCWQQLSGSSGPACGKYGDVQYVGDMHRFGDTETTVEGGCLNELNDSGRGYWDTTCTDPENVYSSGAAYQSFFDGICQVVSPGHTAHVLINDGASCSGSGSIPDSNARGLTAQCLPSTQDATSATGQTYFPASEGPGGTCSGEDEGYDCVWAITVPQSCAYEEGPFTCDTSTNYNDEDLCDEDDGSVLKYYEHDKNDAPPELPIHDITLNGDGTVSFRVLNPFGDDLHDIYTVYHEAADNGNEECNKEQTANSCPSDTTLTAYCLDDGAFAIVTIFAAGFGSDSGATGLVPEGGAGSEIYECCPKTFEPADHLLPENVASWTYVIYCECPDDEANRALRVDEVDAKFQRGELFDEKTKKLYGLLN